MCRWCFFSCYAAVTGRASWYDRDRYDNILRTIKVKVNFAHRCNRCAYYIGNYDTYLYFTERHPVLQKGTKFTTTTTKFSTIFIERHQEWFVWWFRWNLDGVVQIGIVKFSQFTYLTKTCRSPCFTSLP